MREYINQVAVPIPDLATDVAASNPDNPKKGAELPAGYWAIAIGLMKDGMPLDAVHECTGFTNLTLHVYYKDYIRTGWVHKIQHKHIHASLLTKEHKCAICQWIERDPYL